jgi:hypothetical protein
VRQWSGRCSRAFLLRGAAPQNGSCADAPNRLRNSRL